MTEIVQLNNPLPGVHRIAEEAYPDTQVHHYVDTNYEPPRYMSVFDEQDGTIVAGAPMGGYSYHMRADGRTSVTDVPDELTDRSDILLGDFAACEGHPSSDDGSMYFPEMLTLERQKPDDPQQLPAAIAELLGELTSKKFHHVEGAPLAEQLGFTVWKLTNGGRLAHHGKDTREFMLVYDETDARTSQDLTSDALFKISKGMRA